jgi:hypothetical protein
MNKLPPVPIIPMKNDSANNLEKWLKSKCDYEPNYSNEYKSMFGIHDKDGTIYKKGDIDNRLNILLINDMFDDTDDLKQYIDYAYTDNEKKDILIQPDTNHSNTNFFYKLLLNASQNIEGYEIPIIPDNPKKSLNGHTKKIGMSIDKMKTYNFVYNMSK